MKKIITYDPANGHIISFMKIYTDESFIDTNTEKYMETELDSVSNCYVSDGQVIPLRHMVLIVSKASVSANGDDEVTITGIPIGAKILIPSIGSVIAEDSSITLTFTQVGTHPLIFMAQTYHTQEVFINAI